MQCPRVVSLSRLRFQEQQRSNTKGKRLKEKAKDKKDRKKKKKKKKNAVQGGEREREWNGKVRVFGWGGREKLGFLWCDFHLGDWNFSRRCVGF